MSRRERWMRGETGTGSELGGFGPPSFLAFDASSESSRVGARVSGSRAPYPPENWTRPMVSAIHKSLDGAVPLSVYRSVSMSKRIDVAITMAKSAIADCLSQSKRDAEEAKARAKRVREARYTVLQPVLTRLAMILNPLPAEQKSFSISGYGSRPLVTVTLYKQESLKSDLICELLDYVSGVCTESARSRDYVSQYWGERSHSFRGSEIDIDIKIDVSESGTCRKVIKCQKTQVVDEYEFVCD